MILTFLIISNIITISFDLLFWFPHYLTLSMFDISRYSNLSHYFDFLTIVSFLNILTFVNVWLLTILTSLNILTFYVCDIPHFSRPLDSLISYSCSLIKLVV